MITLLSQTDRHPKIKKEALGVAIHIMHLAPADRSGYEVCPGRSAGCTKACLNTAGFRYARKENARIKRTKWFFEDRPAFMIQLVREIASKERSARRQGLRCGIRLNGTSDIPWERIPVLGSELCMDKPNIMSVFPEVAFYDYTKRSNRKNLPQNYRLTFSRSEENENKCAEAFANGMNVAVVFRKELPDTLWCREVIDGDIHDFRYDDPLGVVVGLRAKGRMAKMDTTGFVKDMP